MTAPPAAETAPSELPEAFAGVLGDYERHLVAERDLTSHTVRAYLGDVAGLLDHATRLGLTDVAELDLRSLRRWLAKQQTLGLSRTTLAPRATAARVFTGWLHRTGRASRDAGATLGKSHSPGRDLLAANLVDPHSRAGTDAPGMIVCAARHVSLRDRLADGSCSGAASFTRSATVTF